MTITLDIGHVFLLLTTIAGAIIGIFNKIRYDCIKQASHLVATIEQDKDLTGEQKFAIVVSWIDESLPKIFRNTLVKNFLKYIVQYSYENSVKYMNNYIERKTGSSISELFSKTHINEKL